MKLRLLFLFIFCAAASVFAQTPAGSGQVGVRITQLTAGEIRHRLANNSTKIAPVSEFELEKHAFRLLNEQRQSRGLSGLLWSDEVAKVARVHSSNMAEKGFFSHRGADGLMVDGRADEVGLGMWRAIGENIAFLRGYDDPAEFAVKQWMNSSGHRRNVLSDRWTESGIGLAVAEDGSYYFTQVFLTRE